MGKEAVNESHLETAPFIITYKLKTQTSLPVLSQCSPYTHEGSVDYLTFYHVQKQLLSVCCLADRVVLLCSAFMTIIEILSSLIISVKTIRICQRVLYSLVRSYSYKNNKNSRS